jgi:hypothetical protein
MMNIDHRALLASYILHVTKCGGTNFICRIGDPSVDVQFSDDEVAELKAVEKKAVVLARSTHKQ